MKYRLTIETLTPLHIGSGQDLLRGFDYVDDDHYTYVLDQDTIYAQELEQKGAQARLDQPAGELIATPSHERLAHFVRYRLRGATPKDVTQLREQIKDVFNQCYLPGSSVKGAVRRALMVWAVATQNFPVELSELGEKDKSADDEWEKRIFGRDPNHDALRLLQIADTRPASLNSLMFCHAGVFQNEKDPGSPIDLEAIAPGVVFSGEMQVDELLLQYTNGQKFPNQAKDLKWDQQAPWMTVLPAILRLTARKLLEAEYHIAQDWNWTFTARKYEALLEILNSAPENTVLLQLGWGGGWLAKTIGLALDEGAIFALREKYDLGKAPKAGEDWTPNPNTPFPNSRRLSAISSEVSKDAPGEPLGWVKVAFEPVGTPRNSAYWQILEQKGRTLLDRPWKLIEGPPIPASTSSPVIPQPPASTENSLLLRNPSFTAPPQSGDRFWGVVFDIQPNEIFLSIPGLEDTEDYAVVIKEDFPRGYEFKDGKKELCQVISVEKDKYGAMRVRCKVEV